MSGLGPVRVRVRGSCQGSRFVSSSYLVLVWLFGFVVRVRFVFGVRGSYLVLVWFVSGCAVRVWFASGFVSGSYLVHIWFVFGFWFGFVSGVCLVSSWIRNGFVQLGFGWYF